MTAPRREPDGDGPLFSQVLIELKCAVKRRLVRRGTPVPATDRPYLIVAVLGQSNAQGMGVGLDTTGPDAPHPRVHQWARSGKSKGTAVVGVDPLLHDVPSKGVGFAMTFAKALADETGRPVLLVPCARGDTSFAPKNGYTWDPENRSTRVNLFRDAISAVDDALARFPDSSVALVLWHQGETDVPLTPGPVYEAKLDLVIDLLRERYGAQLPVVLGQMAPEELDRTDRDCSVIDAIHADTPNRRPRTVFVEGPRGAVNGPGDNHYSGIGQRELGRRMWGAYRALCPDDISKYARE